VTARVSTVVAMAAADDTDPLDDYVEAHVHGTVDLGADVEALVLDPGLIGDASRTGRHDEEALKRVWHYVARFGSQEMRPGNAVRAGRGD
jgi:hypothetical protein